MGQETGCREEQGGQGRGRQPGDSAGVQELQAAAQLPLPAAARKRQHHLPSGTAALFLGPSVFDPSPDRVNMDPPSSSHDSPSARQLG
jgi:hypothetical protein